MRKKVRRVLAFLLAIAVAMSVMTGMALSTDTAETGGSETYTAEEVGDTSNTDNTVERQNENPDEDTDGPSDEEDPDDGDSEPESDGQGQADDSDAGDPEPQSDSQEKTVVSSRAKSAPAPAARAASGYSDDQTWFTWGNGYGLIIVNAPGKENQVNLHYKDGRFYCDEACTVECIGIGTETNNDWTGAISWAPLFDVSARCVSYGYDAYLNQADTVSNANGKGYHSPRDIGLLGMMLKYAYQKNNELTNIENLKVNICCHDTYVITPNASEATYNRDAEDGKPVYVASYSAPYWFTGSIKMTRADDLEDAPIISIRGDTTGYINFETGSKLTIDNRTTNPTAPAVLVDDGGLFMLTDGKITNSSASRAGYGVLLQSSGGTANTEHIAAVELGKDDGGSCVIENCAIGIEMKVGCTRFKQSRTGNEAYTLKNNDVAINMHHGTTLGKWSDSISDVLADNVVVTIADPQEWVAGDWLFTSGQQADGTDTHNTPLTKDDVAHMKFANYGDLSSVLNIVFDESVDNGKNYLYPLFKLEDNVVYNTRTGHWYGTLYDAVNPTDEGGSIINGDTLVFYGNTQETQPTEINYDLTIRSAKKGTEDKAVKGNNDNLISGEGYTAHLVAGTDDGNCITVAEGKTVTFGGDTSGPLTFDADGKGRALAVEGAATADENFTVQEGSHADGGGVKIGASGTFTLKIGASLENNSSTGNGGAVYVDAGGTLNVTGGTISGNTAKNGAAVYQGGTFNLSGAPDFSDDDVYLPGTATTDEKQQKVITKAGSFTWSSETIQVTLGDAPENQYDGRNYVESGGTTSDQTVSADDLGLFSITNLEPGFKTLFTENDSLTHAPVLELDAKRSITITKDVSGIAQDAVAGTQFTFTIEGPDDLKGTYSDVTFTNGNATVNIEGCGSKQIVDLPNGTYTVTETKPATAPEGYTFDDTTETTGRVTLTDREKNGTVTITNQYNPRNLTVTVLKKVDGNMGDTNKAFSFSAGNESFTLKDCKANPESKQEIEVPYGGSLTIKETSTGDGYTLTSVTNGDTTLEADADGGYTISNVTADTTITFTNTKNVEVPNGLTHNMTPYIIMVVLAAGAGAFFVVRRRPRGRHCK